VGSTEPAGIPEAVIEAVATPPTPIEALEAPPPKSICMIGTAREGVAVRRRLNEVRTAA
jgi:hypothetical protein